MAVTDDERREVARKLRSVGLDGIRYSDAICEVMACAGLTCVGGEDCHGSDEHPECVVRVFDRLADLIEPSIPADPGEAGLACVDAFIREHTEKPVDRDALLALADEIEGPECVMRCCNGTYAGIMFVAINHERIARRIREALGVVE